MVSSATAGDDVNLPRARVELTIRGPDGRPVAGKTVVVLDGSKYYFQSDERPSATVTSDAQGRITLDWPVGVRRLTVSVPGVGFGATGRFEVVAAATARPWLPPLAPFGAIEGRITTSAIKPGAYIEVANMHQETARTAGCDAGGKFTLEDLPANDYELVLRQNNSSEASRTVTVHVLPGQRTCGVVVGDDRPTNPKVGKSPIDGQGTETSVVWAAGTVRDESGTPLAGVKVLMLTEFSDHQVLNAKVTSTLTDAKGAWKFGGPANSNPSGGIVVAHKPGKPYAGAVLVDPNSDDPENPDPIAGYYELVLPARGGSVQASIMEEGKPLKGAFVRIERECPLTVNAKFALNSAQGPDCDVPAGLLKPIAITDAEGIARFTDLVPGEYHLSAVAGDKKELNNLDPVFPSMYKGPSAKVDGISVRVGETTKCRAVLSPRPNYPATIDFRRPDGRPYVDGQWTTAGSFEDQSFNQSINDDVRKSRYYHFAADGLHEVTCSAGEAKLHRGQESNLPCEQAEAIVPVSPLLPQKLATVLTAARRELGSLVVKVEDPDGKPLAANIFVDRMNVPEIPDFAAATDAHGEVRFDGSKPEVRTVEVLPVGLRFSDLGSGDSPLPDDDKIACEFLPARQEVYTPWGETTRLTVRVARAGYLRVKLRTRAGDQSDRFSVSHSEGDTTLYRERRDKTSGDFLLGPLPVGMAMIKVYDRAAKRARKPILRRELEVRSGRVAHYTIEIPQFPLAAIDPNSLPQACVDGSCGCTSADDLPEIRGRVFMSDGWTPALGALLAYVGPKTVVPEGIGEADALGRISMVPMGCCFSLPSDPLPGSPKEPVLICGLPGVCGMKVIPESEFVNSNELRIILPPPLSVTGRVTIGGKPAKPREHQFVVVANYDGLGKLAPAMSKKVVADADGSFRLNALTPGNYRVQATLDNIWLSPGVTLKVDANTPDMHPLSLDISPLGPGLMIKVVNRKGRAMANVRATVVRPDGPATETLWPKDFRTDGAGVLHIPPLESGRQIIRVQGADERSIDVPPLAGVNAVETEPIVVK
jgi:protocatechuate 3,4-dioxygenase beta subunit